MSKLKQLCPDGEIDINGVKITIAALPFEVVPRFADTINTVIAALEQGDWGSTLKTAYDDITKMLTQCVFLEEKNKRIPIGQIPLPVLPKILKEVIERSFGLGEWRALGGELRAVGGMSTPAPLPS